MDNLSALTKPLPPEVVAESNRVSAAARTATVVAAKPNAALLTDNELFTIIERYRTYESACESMGFFAAENNALIAQLLLQNRGHR